VSESTRIWGLRILALLIAIALWYRFSLEGRETLTERTIDAPVSYNVPRGYVIIDPRQSVRVRLRASSKKLRQLDPYRANVQLELTQQQTGTVALNLSPEDVQLPEGYTVVSIDPDVIQVELDREITQRLPVKPQLVGEPAAGAVVGEAEVLPDQVQVTGPESLLARIQSLSTRPISLDGHALTFEEMANVVQPDALIQIVQPSKVQVTVPLEQPKALEETAPGKAARKSGKHAARPRAPAGAEPP